MGRPKFGDISATPRSSGPRKVSASIASETQNLKKKIARPSRRRPFGVYSVLGVLPSASLATIRKAYRAASLVHHPDKNPQAKTSQEKAALTKKQQEINAVYQLLCDEEERADYDLINNFSKTSTVRVQQHRTRLSRTQELVASSAQTFRFHKKNNPASDKRQRRNPQKRKVGDKCSFKLNGKVEHGTLVEIRDTYANNKHARKWFVCKRPAAQLQKDRRLGAFVSVDEIF